MNNNQRIAEIEKRAQTATRGPWEVEKYYHDEPYDEYIKSAAIIVHKDESNYTITRNDWSNPLEADLNFIAHAREDIPYLLAQLAESQRRADAAVEDMKRINGLDMRSELEMCRFCKFGVDKHCRKCDFGKMTNNFEWRGLQDKEVQHEND